jgi:hypothetical protein
MKVFVSYAHTQGAWVWGRLVPVLKAGGAEVLIDRERFEAGFAVVGQMDGWQDQAERQLICWSADHAASDACRHEWRRALAKDPEFTAGLILLARLDGVALPAELPADLHQPLYIDLRDDSKPDSWELLLRGCAAEFGASAPAWLCVRDEVADALRRFRSVNLVVRGNRLRWRELIEDVKKQAVPDLALVDLQDPRAHMREGLLAAILAALRMGVVKLPKKPQDLVKFRDKILALGGQGADRPHALRSDPASVRVRRRSLRRLALAGHGGRQADDALRAVAHAFRPALAPRPSTLGDRLHRRRAAMNPVPLGALRLRTRHHLSAFWWLALLYRRPRVFQLDLEERGRLAIRRRSAYTCMVRPMCLSLRCGAAPAVWCLRERARTRAGRSRRRVSSKHPCGSDR